MKRLRRATVGHTYSMSQAARSHRHDGRGILPLAAVLILVGVVLTAAVILLLVAVLGEDGTIKPDVGGALAASRNYGEAAAGKS